MTESQIRQSVIDLARTYLGIQQGSEEHWDILDTYNNQLPLPRNYKLKEDSAWCAGFVTAILIKLGYQDICPCECGCGEMRNKSKLMGIYNTDFPKVGDIIFFDLSKNDNYPDHVAFVSSVTPLKFLGGNQSGHSVSELDIGDYKVLGYAHVDYTSKATPEVKTYVIETTDQAQAKSIADNYNLQVKCDGEVVYEKEKEPQLYAQPTTRVNIRKGPGTNYGLQPATFSDGVRTSMKVTDVEPIVGEQSGWYQVNINGTLAWCSGKYINIVTE